jgi:hypothetical protein
MSAMFALASASGTGLVRSNNENAAYAEAVGFSPSPKA